MKTFLVVTAFTITVTGNAGFVLKQRLQEQYPIDVTTYKEGSKLRVEYRVNGRLGVTIYRLDSGTLSNYHLDSSTLSESTFKPNVQPTVRKEILPTRVASQGNRTIIYEGSSKANGMDCEQYAHILSDNSRVATECYLVPQKTPNFAIIMEMMSFGLTQMAELGSRGLLLLSVDQSPVKVQEVLSFSEKALAPEIFEVATIKSSVEKEK